MKLDKTIEAFIVKEFPHSTQAQSTVFVSGWQRIKIGFKWREWDGKIVLDKIEDREKMLKLQQV